MDTTKSGINGMSLKEGHEKLIKPKVADSGKTEKIMFEF